MTFVEIFVVILITSIVVGLLGTFLWRNARTSRATDRKLQAIRAVHYVEGRLRRDMKGAKSFEVDDDGSRLTIRDHQDRQRTYQFDPDNRTLTLPELLDPSSTVVYAQARFRKVLFIKDADEIGITFVLSAVPFNDPGRKLTVEELGWGSAIAGRVAVMKRSQSARHPEANLQGLKL